MISGLMSKECQVTPLWNYITLDIKIKPVGASAKICVSYCIEKLNRYIGRFKSVTIVGFISKSEYYFIIHNISDNEIVKTFGSVD